MNDEAAFVAAIAAAPDDHHLPLVFADWLDDRGDPRGPWVRSHAVRPWMAPTYESPVPKLLEALAKGKRVMEVRRAAAVIGAPMVPGLVELLKHPTPRVRRQACICLRNVGKPAKDAVPALLDALADSDESVREQAAKALRGIGAGEGAGTDRLKAALTDDNWNVRRTASKVLGSMRAKGGVLRELVEQFDSPDPDDRKKVIGGLRQLGTADTIPTLDRALDDPEPEVREAAVEALQAVGSESVPALCRAMKDPIARVRMKAAERFDRHAFTPELVAALTALLGDPVGYVRRTACDALAHVRGELAPPLVPRIVALLDDLDPEVRRGALWALREIAVGDQPTLRALIAELADPNAEHRKAAVHAAAAVGRDPAALAALVPLIADPSDEVAWAAVAELARWAKLPASVVPPLVARYTRLRAGADNNSYLVLTALGRVEPPTAEAIDTLREAARTTREYGYDQRAALDALAAIGPAAAGAIPDIVDLFRDADTNPRHSMYEHAAKALVRIGGSGFDRLAELIDRPYDGARAHIYWSFNELREAALPLLPAVLRRLNDPDDAWLRVDAVRAIHALGPGATDAIPALVDVLESLEPAHRRGEVLAVLVAFGAALAPHLPRLAELSRRPEFAASRGSFATLFAKLAPHEPGVREPLRELLRATDKFTRQTCAAALLSFNDAALLPDLAPLVADPEADIRRDIVYQFDKLDTPAVLPLIRQALTDAEEGVRLRAIEVLARRADTSDETVAAVVHALEDRAPKVRRAAADALGKLKVGTDAVRAALSAATEDADAKVAERAAIALKKVTPKEPKDKKAPAKAKGKKKPK